MTLKTIVEDFHTTDNEGYSVKQWYELTDKEKIQLLLEKQNQIINHINSKE